MQPIATPWLSPKEVTVKSFPMVFPDMGGILKLKLPLAHAWSKKNLAVTSQVGTGISGAGDKKLELLAWRPLVETS